ncbi:FAD:protein FMN transferase [Spirochaetia bacterium]|nr:FAD:protein FMN transferase [Spirochaetia bacterium]
MYDKGTRKLYQSIFNRFNEIEDHLSANKAGTDIAKVNAAAGIAPVVVHEDTFTVTEAALRYAESSGGAFDPTIGPLVQLWNIGFNDAHVPAQQEIDYTLPLVDFRDLQLNSEQSSIYLPRLGMKLDLGAITKGYAADEAVRIAREAKSPRGVINLGGNVYAFGVKKDGSPWNIGIKDPLEEDSIVGIAEVRNKTIVTSGVYERFFEADGMRYHHILSPVDGYPARTGLLSTTIIADRSLDGDALSTAVFVLGYERGHQLIESIPGIDAIFVFEDMSIRGTAGVIESFTLTNELFRVRK